MARLEPYLHRLEEILTEKKGDYLAALGEECGIYDNFRILVGWDLARAEVALAALPGYHGGGRWTIGEGSGVFSPTGHLINVWGKPYIFADNPEQEVYRDQFHATYVLHGNVFGLPPVEVHFIEAIALATLDIGRMLAKEKVPCCIWDVPGDNPLSPYQRGLDDFLPVNTT